MESIILSQKSVTDIKDPLIKELLGDVTTIMRAELLQNITAAKKPTTKSRQAVSEHFQTFEKSYAQLDANEKKRIDKLAKSLNTADFRAKAQKLGITANLEKPASQQIDYEKSFSYLKGKEKAVNNSLDSIGSQIVVPFSMFPDEETQGLIGRIKKVDKDAGEYADYLALADKEKLFELYERHLGKIEDKNTFFQSHQPDAAEATTVKRTVMQWQNAPTSDKPRFRNRYLRLYTTRVRCLDETEHEGAWPFEGEGIANDRIDLSAVSLSPTGSSSLFGPQTVSDNFEDNREFWWNRELARFDLNTGGMPYPLNFGTTITIAEIDYGAGFANTMRDIYNGVRGAIVEIVSKIGEILGSLLSAGEVGKFIGKAIGELIVLGLGEIINIISRAVQDDVFTPQVAAIQIDSPYSTFYGVSDVGEAWPSPEQVMRFDGFGGSYAVHYKWELIREREA